MEEKLCNSVIILSVKHILVIYDFRFMIPDSIFMHKMYDMINNMIVHFYFIIVFINMYILNAGYFSTKCVNFYKRPIICIEMILFA